MIYRCIASSLIGDSDKILAQLIQELEQDYQGWLEQDVCLLMSGVSWQYYDHQLVVYCLRGDQYEQSDRSQLLPQLDLKVLPTFISHSQPLAAVKEFRQSLRANF